MRPAWLEIDLGVVRGNYRALRATVGAGCEVIPIVKANAYGHGLVPVTRALEEEGVGRVGVALAEEGIMLREAGVKCGILVLGASLPEEAEGIVQHELAQSVCTAEAARALSREAERRGKPARVEIKVDTGMGRIGIRPEEVGGFLEGCSGMRGIEVEGIWSHLATADEEDGSYAEEQFRCFRECLKLKERARGLRFHLCNSAGIVNHSEMWLDGVRPGLLLYGIKPAARERVKIGYRAAMALRSKLNFVKKVRKGEGLSYGRTFVAEREMVVGTVPVGYADGYPRSLSNVGEVLFRGERAAIVGRVCMDQFLVDLTRYPDARIGEEVVLMGKQGEAEITAREVAERAGTIANEILSRMGERLPRVYKEESASL